MRPAARVTRTESSGSATRTEGPAAAKAGLRAGSQSAGSKARGERGAQPGQLGRPLQTGRRDPFIKGRGRERSRKRSDSRAQNSVRRPNCPKAVRLTNRTGSGVGTQQRRQLLGGSLFLNGSPWVTVSSSAGCQRPAPRWAFKRDPLRLAASGFVRLQCCFLLCS